MLNMLTFVSVFYIANQLEHISKEPIFTCWQLFVSYNSAAFQAKNE